MEQKTVWPVGCGPIPAPTEVACIYVKKIYDACSQRECEEFFFEVDLNTVNPVQPANLAVECTIVPGSEAFSDWSIEPIDGGPLGLVRVNVCATLSIIIRDVNNVIIYSAEEEICFFKEVVLYAPDPVNMQVLVESIFEALACSIAVTNGAYVVTAVVGAFIIVKTGLNVQLLVPAFGFCPVPPECEELGDLCEQFLQRPFPPFFPPQLIDLNNG